MNSRQLRRDNSQWRIRESLTPESHAALPTRVCQLAERDATPLPQLTDEVATLASRVEEHLGRMGNGELKMESGK